MLIGLWNIHGLNDKLEENDFVNSILKFDICFLLETHQSETFSLDNRYIYCKQAIKHGKRKGRKSGGIAVVMKKELKTAVKIFKETEYGLWIKIKSNVLKCEKDLYVCGVYLPGESSPYVIKNAFELMEQDVSSFPRDVDVLMLGDMNARTGSVSETLKYDKWVGDLPVYTPPLSQRYSQDQLLNIRGKALIRFCQVCQFYIVNGRTFGDIPGNTTCVQQGGASVVDYVLASYSMLGKVQFLNVLPLNQFSDHSIIKLSLHLPYASKTQPEYNYKPLPVRYKWNEYSKEKFEHTLTRADIKKMIVNVKNEFQSDTTNTDTLCTSITNIFTKTAESSLKKVKRASGASQKYYTWQENQNFQHLKKQLHDLSKHMQRNPHDPIVRGNFFSLKKNFSKVLKKHKREQKEELLDKIRHAQEKNPAVFWNLVKTIKSKKVNGETIDPEDFLNHFKELHTAKPEKHFDNAFTSHLDTYIQENKMESKIDELDEKITLKELHQVARTLKNKKTSAFDSISNEMIKCSLNHLGDIILHLFNRILNTGDFPKQWSEGYISPIFKSGDQNNPSNYRGITVSSCLGKFFTKILNTRLLKYLVDNKIIPNNQIGFVPGNRTADHILLLKTLIDSYKKVKKKLFICFIDFSKAFDTVFRPGLIYKLMQLKISSKLISIVQAMYKNVTASVKTEKGLTTSFPIEVGTRQGCNLSPTLFNLYLYDLPKEFGDNCKPVSLNNSKLSCLMYADDLVLFSETERGMKTCLLQLEHFCSKWRLSINSSKSKILIINEPRNHTYTFKIFEDSLEVVKSYKYLGIIIDKKANFHTAIEELSKKASRAYYSIRRHFNFSNNTAPNTILKLFESMVQPILLYGCEIWGVFGWRKNNNKCTLQYLFNNKHSFEKLHTQLCRSALGINRYATEIMVKSELGRYPLMANILQHTYAYWQHILNVNEHSLLHQTLQHLKNQHRIGHVNFYSRFHTLLSTLESPGFILKCKTSQIKNNSRIFRQVFCKKYEDFFFKTLEDKGSRVGSGGRYELYYRLKRVYRYERYLNMKNNNLRRCLTNIRISTHCLPVEHMRKFNIERSNRYCNLCDVNAVGSEEHVLLYCQNREIQSLREILYNKIIQTCEQFTNLQDTDKFKYLLMCIDENCNFYFAIYLDKIFRLICNKRK